MGTALSGLYLAFSASPTLPVAAGLVPAVLAEIASFANTLKALRSGLYLVHNAWRLTVVITLSCFTAASITTLLF